MRLCAGAAAKTTQATNATQQVQVQVVDLGLQRSTKGLWMSGQMGGLQQKGSGVSLPSAWRSTKQTNHIKQQVPASRQWAGPKLSGLVPSVPPPNPQKLGLQISRRLGGCGTEHSIRVKIALVLTPFLQRLARNGQWSNPCSSVQMQHNWIGWYLAWRDSGVTWEVCRDGKGDLPQWEHCRGRGAPPLTPLPP